MTHEAIGFFRPHDVPDPGAGPGMSLAWMGKQSMVVTLRYLNITMEDGYLYLSLSLYDGFFPVKRMISYNYVSLPEGSSGS